MAQDVLHHGPGDERLVAAVRPAQQEGLGGRLGGQSERRQSVHDEVDPQHLDGLQGGVLQEEVRSLMHIVMNTALVHGFLPKLRHIFPC